MLEFDVRLEGEDALPPVTGWRQRLHPREGYVETIIERGVILAPDGGAIDIGHLFSRGEKIHGQQFKLGQGGELSATAVGDEAALADGRQLPALLRQALGQRLITLDTLEAMLVEAAHGMAGGNVAAAAKLLGTTRSRVAYRLAGRPGKKPLTATD